MKDFYGSRMAIPTPIVRRVEIQLDHSFAAYSPFNRSRSQGIDTLTALREVALTWVDNQSTEDSADLYRDLRSIWRTWHEFWLKSALCHPGACCTCCGDLPDINIQFLLGNELEPDFEGRPGVVLEDYKKLREEKGHPDLNWHDASTS